MVVHGRQGVRLVATRVQMAWASAGVSLPRTTYQQVYQGRRWRRSAACSLGI